MVESKADYWTVWQQNTDLIRAAAEGDLDKVKQLCEEQNAWPWFDSKLGETAWTGGS
jgi:hypothetical protein